MCIDKDCIRSIWRLKNDGSPAPNSVFLPPLIIVELFRSSCAAGIDLRILFSSTPGFLAPLKDRDFIRFCLSLAAHSDLVPFLYIPSPHSFLAGHRHIYTFDLGCPSVIVTHSMARDHPDIVFYYEIQTLFIF